MQTRPASSFLVTVVSVSRRVRSRINILLVIALSIGMLQIKQTNGTLGIIESVPFGQSPSAAITSIDTAELGIDRSIFEFSGGSCEKYVTEMVNRCHEVMKNIEDIDIENVEDSISSYIGRSKREETRE